MLCPLFSYNKLCRACKYLYIPSLKEMNSYCEKSSFENCRLYHRYKEAGKELEIDNDDDDLYVRDNSR